MSVRRHFRTSDPDISCITSFNGSDPKEFGNVSLETGGRWRALDYRTSSKPFSLKYSYLRMPSQKLLRNRHGVGLTHWLWNVCGKNDRNSCWCHGNHPAVFTKRTNRKQPKYFKERGFATDLPEFAVVAESEVERVFGVSFPSGDDPEMSEESKRFMQHIFKRYRIRLAQFEAQKGGEKRKLLRSSSNSHFLSVSGNATDYSLLKSADVPLPTQQSWVIIFHESWLVDRGVTKVVAHRFADKLSSYEIPYIIIEISHLEYSKFTGVSQQARVGRYRREPKRKDKFPLPLSADFQFEEN